jgi:hypothetical protein
MDALGSSLALIGILSAIVEKLNEWIFQILANVGLATDKLKAWKPTLVFFFSVLACILLSLDVLPALGIYFVYPLPWLGYALTGVLVGGGADILHITKNKLDPQVKA